MPLKPPPAPPIAIVGMGMRLPGGISTAEGFWDLLVNKRSGKCRVPDSRYNVNAFFGNQTHQQNVATDQGYFLDLDIKAFDAGFFNFPRMGLDITDPQLRLLLEVVWECIENAGQTTLRGTNTGVFVGTFGEDWHNILHRDTSTPNLYRAIGSGDYSLSNVLSWQYDLSGPSMTIRSACSSSLSAVHIACQALYNGDCPAAIVAGCSLIMDPTMTIDMSQGGILSSSASCKTFDAEADGFARGEAINAILLKPLEDALRDGDPIRAVIRSTSVNSDGRTTSIGTPNQVAQTQMIRRAYERAGIEDFSQTPYIECHGTGTIRGDPIEAAAVAKVFGDRGAYIGSVKTNLGHGEGAAALTSIIKAVLSLENTTIPPNINFSTPNPNIPFEEYKLQVPVEPIPWPKDRHERISINSFGIGGANGHVILDSAASFGVQTKPPIRRPSEVSAANVGAIAMQASENSSDDSSETKSEWEVISEMSSAESSEDIPKIQESSPLKKVLATRVKTKAAESVENTAIENTNQPLPFLLPISAESERSLESRVHDLKQYLDDRPECLGSAAHTLSLRRVHLKHRAFAITTPSTDGFLEFESREKASTAVSSDDGIVFVFTGQGAQWPGMGRSLLATIPSFLEDIRAMDQVLQQLTPPPAWNMEEFLSHSHQANAQDVNKAEFSQPLCTAIQIGLVNFLSKCGISPKAVIGHSSGEIAAAYSAGALTMSEAILAAYFRGLATQSPECSRSGGMAAVGLGKDAFAPYANEGIRVACENSPTSVTISGDLDAVHSTLEDIKSADSAVFTRLLPVNIAYHSDHMNKIGQVYEDMLKPHLSARAPDCPFYSTVTGDCVQGETRLDAEYWRCNLESPVLFNTTMAKLLNNVPDVSTILEIGPHFALRGPIGQILKQERQKRGPCTKGSPNYVATLCREETSCSSLLAAVGKLYVLGHKVDFASLSPPAPVLTDLPNYPWDRDQRFWKESRLSEAWRLRKHPHHELLGSRCAEAAESEPMWRNVLHHSDVPWLADHKVESDTVLPAAGYIAMMGEAIRQYLGSQAYELRNLMIKSVLLVSQKDPVEVITTMRPLRLTGLSNSASWWTFSISSFDGTSWVENCMAEGKTAEERSPDDNAMAAIPPHVRQVPTGYFYNHIRHLGLKCGPSFQLLSDIFAHTAEYSAIGTLRNDVTQYEAPYAVHPAVIDACVQLTVLARGRGISRELKNLALPVEIQHIVIYPGTGDLDAQASLAPETYAGTALAATKDGKLVVKLEHGLYVPFNTGQHLVNKAPLHAARVEWLPDIDCLENTNELLTLRRSNIDKLMLSERGCILSILQLFDVLKSLETPLSGHFIKYGAWLAKERDLILQGQRDDIDPEARQWASLDMEAREKLLDSLVEQISGPENANLCGIIKTYQALSRRSTAEPILTGQTNPSDLLQEDGVMRHFYDLLSESVNMDSFISLCAHSKPVMRILEVGAGTGAMSEVFLKNLVSDSGVRMYSQYVFTDLPSDFLPFAKERLKAFDQVEYKSLNIEADPAEQGFELGSFDLIIASNVLHATSALRAGLENIRALLRPGGRLYLHEPVLPMRWRQVHLFAGLLPGWWTEQEDDRSEVPCVSVQRWLDELDLAGFSGTDAVIMDEDDPKNAVCAHIISTNPAVVPDPKTILLLYHVEKHEFGYRLAEALEQHGVPTRWVKLGHEDDLIDSLDTISTIDLEGPFFNEISEEDYKTFLVYLAKFKSESGMLWLTRPAQIDCTDPAYGIGSGYIRSIRIELGIDFWTLELDSLNSSATTAAMAVCRKFRQRSPSNETIDSEYAVKNGTVYTGRYHWVSTEEELRYEQNSDPKKLLLGQPGVLSSMELVHCDAVEPLDDEVEVDVRYMGVNFRDVMVAMGIIRSSADDFGLEASGVITQIGKAVTDLKVGDRVVVLGERLFTTRRVLPVKHVHRIPESISLEEAATIPVVYITAIHALCNLGNLSRGQSVLIHSAAGGVGQAAIHISQIMGAEIYATVGNEEKAQHVVDQFGISRERIFDSRSSSFRENIMHATGGRGVDIVLNSLSGELLHASWQCVAKNGKMMEIGKRDMLAHGHLALDGFQSNRTFYGVDIRDLGSVLPRSMDKFAQLLDKHQLKPIQPIHVFSMKQAPDAFRFMKAGHHFGKIVIKMPEATETIIARKPHEPTLLSPTSTYLLVGGLGGLGKEIAKWMVERGARSFLFLSPSANDMSKHGCFFKELETQGCRLTLVGGSVIDMADVVKAIEAAPTAIAGVVHMPMTLRDLPLLEVTYEDWRAVQDPKVKGAWNLHKALPTNSLEFFILFSSIVSVTGHPCQSNYASANSFLDSFVQFRHGLDLPCSVINLGAVEGIGILGSQPQKLNQLRQLGVYILQEEHVMQAFRIAIQRASSADGLQPVGSRNALVTKSQLVVGLRTTRSLAESRNTRLFTSDVRFSMYLNLDAEDKLASTTQDDELQALLRDAEQDPALLDLPEALKRTSWEIGVTLFRFLALSLEDLDTSMTLQSIGVDSLVSIEIRNWWRKTMKTEVTVLEIMKAGTIHGLGRLAISSIKQRLGISEDAAPVGGDGVSAKDDVGSSVPS